mgnify:CR=1 FL=1
MFKVLLFTSASALSLLDLGTQVLSEDFYSGAETGFIIENDTMFNDYSCSLPQLTGPVQNYLQMIEPFKKMLDTTAAKGRETHPMSDLLGRLTGTIEKLGQIISLVSFDYDSGDFCKGLTLAYYGKATYRKWSQKFF